MKRLMLTIIAGMCDWIGNRLYTVATRFWNAAKRIRFHQVIRAQTTESEERMWERAATEAGYAPLPEYVERHGGEHDTPHADDVVSIPHHGRIG